VLVTLASTSATPTISSVDDVESSNGGLSKGAIAGIAIGAVLGAAALVVIGILLYRHQPNPAPTTAAAVTTQNLDEKNAGIAKNTAVQEIPSGRLKYPGEEPLSGRLSVQQQG
jgi:hypothetical protein